MLNILSVYDCINCSQCNELEMLKISLYTILDVIYKAIALANDIHILSTQKGDNKELVTLVSATFLGILAIFPCFLAELQGTRGENPNFKGLKGRSVNHYSQV